MNPNNYFMFYDKQCVPNNYFMFTMCVTIVKVLKDVILLIFNYSVANFKNFDSTVFIPIS